MALYILISVLSCLFGVISTVGACIAIGYYAHKRSPQIEQVVEIDPELLAEVIAEKLSLDAALDRAQKMSAA